MVQILAGISKDVADFVTKLDNSAEYECKDSVQRYQISFRGTKVGGLDVRKSEWYFSKSFVERNKCGPVVKEGGFKFVVHNPNIPNSHTYWALKSNSHVQFENVLVKITGIKP